MKAKIVAAIILVLPIMLAGCGDPCSSELLLTSDSPNRLAQASFSRANCGATTGYSYEVRVSQGKNAAVSGDTVLRFDDNHATEWPDNDREVIGFSWSDDSHLEIKLSQPVRTFKQESSSDGINVRFDFMKGTIHL